MSPSTPLGALSPEEPARAPAAEPLTLGDIHDAAQRIAGNVARVLVGKPEAVRTALITLLAEGHLLVEDVPGVGKTLLAKALARSIDCTISRIQFTPDLLPSDITGVSVYHRGSGDFEFRPGPVFANVVVGDEINRASPKTQSALLECMEERQVTVDGQSYPLTGPFMVIATQNPVEMEGTYALPEAQRDRFTTRISLGYPEPEDELAMIDEHAGTDPLASLTPVSTAAEVSALGQAVRRIHVSTELRRYVVELVGATRTLAEVRLGASPRATLQLIRAGRAHAALDGRGFVVPDDVHAVAQAVLSHRLVLTPEANAARRSAADLIRIVLRRIPVPRAPAGPDARRVAAALRGTGAPHGAVPAQPARPAAQEPASQQPASQQPAAQEPAAQQPASQQPAAAARSVRRASAWHPSRVR